MQRHAGWCDMDSKYTIERGDNGFMVIGQDRRTTIVNAKPTGFIYGLEGETQARGRCGLFEYYTLSAGIADCLMNEWQPPDRGRDYTPIWVQRWARKQTAKAIGKRV